MEFLLKDQIKVLSTRAKDDSPYAYENLTLYELNKNNTGKDIPYLLDFTPSVTITSDAGGGIGYTGIRIRGSDANRINVTINGIPYNDAESHGVFLGRLTRYRFVNQYHSNSERSRIFNKWWRCIWRNYKYKNRNSIRKSIRRLWNINGFIQYI